MKTPPDIAYYYRAPYWGPQESDWVKSLLLFFDGVSILLPNYMYGRHELADPVLAGSLEERGLLRVLKPETWIDENMAGRLAEIMMGLLGEGAFDDLPEARHFHELSRSRMGYSADVKLAESLVEELRSRGLACPSDDGVTVPLHPDVRMTILMLLGQLSRVTGPERGLSIHPVANDPPAVRDLAAAFSSEGMPSYGRFVKLDLEEVSFDLSSVPLDDVLDFRREHRDLHRAYMRDLLGFLVQLASIDGFEDRERALRERRKEIIDAAADIRRAAAHEFHHRLGSWSLGISGFAWPLAAGGALSTVLGAVKWIWDQLGAGEETVTAYQYLFAAEAKWSRSDGGA